MCCSYNITLKDRLLTTFLFALLLLSQSIAEVKGGETQRNIFPETPSISKTIVYVQMQPYNFETRLMLVSLQGIVNQKTPSLYLIWNESELQWLEWYRKKGYIASYKEVKNIRSLLQKRYRKQWKGAIVYDPNFSVTINVATTLAGLKGGLVATAELADKYELPVLKDLRGLWKKKVDAYEWMYEVLWPKMNHRLVAFHPPKRIEQRDYAIQHKVFTFWVSGTAETKEPGTSIEEETRFAEKILKAMPPNTPVFGFPYAGKGFGPGELPGIQLFTRFAKFNICDSPNLSVHAGIKIKKLKQRPAPSAMPLEKNKIYVTFTLSDGDNLNVWDSFHLKLWNDPQRGKAPINWNVMPSAIELIPGIMEYYYETATENDYFVVAGSGIGYANPFPYGREYSKSDALLRDYIEQLKIYMDRMDLTVLNQYHLLLLFFGDPYPFRKVKEILSLYVQGIPHLKAITPDYTRIPTTNYANSHYLLKNVPVFHALTQFDYLGLLPHGTDVKNRVRELKKFAPKDDTGFINAFLVNWPFQMKDIETILQLAGPRFVPVRADTMAELYLKFAQKER